LQQKSTDPVKGELYEPVVVVPPVLIQPSSPMLITRSGQPQPLKFTYRAMKDMPAAPKPGLAPIEGWQAKLQSPATTGKVSKGNELDFAYLLTPEAKAKAEGKQTFNCICRNW
jgi:hypothetical protein